MTEIPEQTFDALAHIPHDLREVAATIIVKHAYDAFEIERAIGEALVAEREAQRERDAKIAEKHFDFRHADKARFASASIAAAIRKG